MVTAGRDALVPAAVCRSLRVVHHLHVASRRVYYLDWRRSGRWEGRRVIEATLPACANPRRRIDGTRVARTRHLSRPPRLANLALLGLKQPRFPSEAASRPRRLDLRPPEESHSLRRGGTRCSRHPRFGVAARTRECWWVSPARGHTPSVRSDGFAAKVFQRTSLPPRWRRASGRPATTATRCRYYRIPGSVRPLELVRVAS
jgi:hypothetical protein